jgi:hypothetical protein
MMQGMSPLDIIYGYLKSRRARRGYRPYLKDKSVGR